MSKGAIRLVKDDKNTDKQKAIEAALSQIDKAFGKGSVMKLGQRPSMDIEAISTGSLAASGRSSPPSLLQQGDNI